MKINERCLPCLVNQVVKVANMSKATDRSILYQKVFRYLSTLDFDLTNPEIIGQTFNIVKQHINNDDPYRELRNYYNELFLAKSDEFEKNIDSFETAVKYAIIGNIIDFNPINNNEIQNIDSWFINIQSLKLTINHLTAMIEDLKQAQSILYLGDNCGEICLDKILIKRIKTINPHLKIYFGVRGQPVVNDSIEADAYYVGLDQYATIISNGDDSLGTVLARTSSSFKEIYQQVDLVIAKGQANFESLSEENKKIYFLLMVKCDVIASYLQVPQKSLVCLKKVDF